MFGEKDEDVPEEVTWARNFTLKEFSKILCDTENPNDKILEADPNLERTMTTCQGREKMPIPHHKSQEEKKLLLISFLLRNKTFSFSKFLMF